MIKKTFIVTTMVFCLLLINNLVNADTNTFFDDFEAQSIDPFWTDINQDFGTVVLSSDQAYSGSQSAKFSSTSGGDRWIWLRHEFPNVIKGNVSVWFYDTAPNKQTLYATLSLHNSTIPSGESGNYFYLGVDDWNANTYGVYGPESSGDPSTSVSRTVGWHKFEIKTSSTGGQMFIDDILVHSYSGDFGFNAVQLYLFGPSWRPNATYYFEDFSLDAVCEEPVALDIIGSVIISIAGHINLSVINAVVSLQGTDYSTTTDTDGNFTLSDIPTGNYVLNIGSPGLMPLSENISVTAGQDLSLGTKEMKVWIDGSIGLDEAIYALQVVSGIRK